MQFPGSKDACPSMPPLPCSPPPPVKDVRSKYCQEIGAEMIGNHLIIRLEKDKDKSKKKRDEWDPPCDCIEIQRPTSKTGARIINATQDDRVIFRVHTPSTSQTEESGYTSQTIGYKIGPCANGLDHRCKTITVYPQLGTPGSQRIYTDHVTEDGQDIFLLRIKKKAEGVDQRNRNVELELRTPKLPIPLTPPPQPSPVSAVTRPQPLADPEDANKGKKDMEDTEDTKVKELHRAKGQK